MIQGVGIDLVEIERIQDWYTKRPEMVNKILTKDELNIFNKIKLESRKIEFISGRFAVKEAFSKAMGTGMVKSTVFTRLIVYQMKMGNQKSFVKAIVFILPLHTRNIMQKPL
ncbi:holo-ACP synthase [Mammaliicoccus sciuri]